MNELQRQVYRYLRVLSWVLTVAVVGSTTLAITTHAASFALFPLFVTDIAAAIWLHMVKWAFPYLCEIGASRDRAASDTHRARP